MLFSNSIRLVIRSSRNVSKRNSSHVAFIGMGNMGARMATNLLKKGQQVKVYDILESASKSVAGAQVCKSPQEAADGCSIIITMLPNGDVVKETYLADNGILKGASKNSILVDSSTIDPKTAGELSEIAKNNQLKFIDAPVSGGVTGAAAATLTFMTGGDPNDVKAVEQVLLKMGGRVVHCGQIGAGQVAKLCNNLILGATMIATAEAMNLGMQLGLDAKVLSSIVNTSTGRSWSSETYNPVPGLLPNVPSSNGYEGGFSTALISKDLALAENAAVSCGAPVPLTAASHQIYRTMTQHKLGNKDFSAVFKFFRGESL